MLPSLENPNRYNEITAELGEIKPFESRYLSRIEEIDSQLKTEIDPTVEIALKQLEVIASLQAGDYTTISRAKYELRDMLKELKLRSCKRYKKWLKTQEKSEIKREKQLEDFTEIMEAKTVTGSSIFISNTIKEMPSLKDELDRKITNLASKRVQLVEIKSLLDEQLEILYASTNRDDLMIEQENLISTSNPSDIWKAAANGSLYYVKENQRSRNPSDLNGTNKEGFTPLSLAISNGHIQMVDLLLELGANPNAPDTLGYQPLHWAAKKGDILAAIQLRRRGARLNSKGEYGRTPLHMASYNNHPSMVTYLLSEGADINAQTDEGAHCVTSLHHAAMFDFNEVYGALLRNDHLNVNQLDSNGQSPLFYAVGMGNDRACERILNHPSMDWTLSEEDPNHVEQLIKTNIPRNAEAVRMILKRFCKEQELTKEPSRKKKGASEYEIKQF